MSNQETVPTDSARETFEFWDRQTRLLGERDPIQILDETPAVLGHLTQGLSETDLNAEIIAGKWSIRQIILHLADMEWVFGFRIRTIVGDDEPVLAPVEQADWAGRLDRPERTTAHCLNHFRSLRSLNLDHWRSLTPEQLQRCGIHQATGVRLSLERIRIIQAGHDLSHRSQIEERLSLLAPFEKR